MEKLIGIDSDYWNTFLGQDEGEDLYRDSRWAFLIPWISWLFWIVCQVPVPKHPGYPYIFYIQVDIVWPIIWQILYVTELYLIVSQNSWYWTGRHTKTIGTDSSGAHTCWFSGFQDFCISCPILIPAYRISPCIFLFSSFPNIVETHSYHVASVNLNQDASPRSQFQCIFALSWKLAFCK